MRLDVIDRNHEKRMIRSAHKTTAMRWSNDIENRRNIAAKFHNECSCYKCPGKGLSLVGNHKVGWLRFCAKHADIGRTVAIVLYRIYMGEPLFKRKK